MQGYSRVRVDGVVYPLSEPPKLKKQEKHDIEVVVDRLTVKAGSKQRLTDSVETALRLAEGIVVLDFVDREENAADRERRFSEKLACPNGHALSIDDLEPRSFSFNSPYGACPECTGLGIRKEVDPDLVVPDPELSLEDGAIAPWSMGQSSEYFGRLLSGLGDILGFDMKTPWNKLPAKARRAILEGSEEQVHVRYKNRYGRTRSYYAEFEGVMPFLHRRLEQTESDQMKERYDGYMRDTPCPACGGARLRPEILSVTIANEKFGMKSIAEVCELSISDCADFLNSLTLGSREEAIAGQVLKEVQARLGFLLDVGLEYLSLARAAGTLSGGEAQRIRLATQIGSGLVGVLYVLDEPSIGLHQRDNRRLIETLTRLRDLGNTLIVVEHDEDTIRTSDWVVDIGPLAGEHGGKVVHSGPYQELLDCEESLTGATCRAAVTSRFPRSAVRSIASGRSRSSARANTTWAASTSASLWACSRRSPACPGPVSRRSSTTSSRRSWRISSTARGRCPAGTPASTGSTSWTSSCRSTSRRSAAPRGPTRPPTPGCSTRSAPCSPPPPSRRCAATSPAGSRSTSRAAGARPAPATAR